jgi:hypothetical protein
MYSVKNLDRYETYVHSAFITLRGFLPFWRKNKHTLRAHPRALYEWVISVGTKKTDKSGYISELYPYDLGTYRDSKGDIQNDRMVNDHFLSPQTVGEFVLDNPDPYLEDFELFKKLFKCISSTHRIRKSQNDGLSKLKHTVPTVYKYQHNNIELYDSFTKEPVDNLIKPMVYVSDTFFDEYCQWERKMVLNMDTEYGEPLPVEMLHAQKAHSTTSLDVFYA